MPESTSNVSVVTITKDGAVIATLTVQRAPSQGALAVTVAQTVRVAESFLVGSPSYVTFTLEVLEGERVGLVDHGGPSPSSTAALARVLDAAGLGESVLVGFSPRILFIREAASVDSSRISESTTVVRL